MLDQQYSSNDAIEASAQTGSFNHQVYLTHGKPPALVSDNANASENLATTGILPQLSLERVVTELQDGAQELFDQTRDLANPVMNYAENNPLDAMGCAAGALIGGVVGAIAAPELKIGTAVGALVGAVGVDGLILSVVELTGDQR